MSPAPLLLQALEAVLHGMAAVREDLLTDLVVDPVQEVAVDGDADPVLRQL